ncbi:MAG: hypothetical protein HFI19_00395 [Lachnospiraceae bacterium]|uniref:hypothetical protein n=1 Tax=Candidatus Merdisoma sp. JLR.KK006 TaxID=3112626 RepID=UPI002FEFCB73|nr:hypothetical protein [Lachnospiraceae bacterium]
MRIDDNYYQSVQTNSSYATVNVNNAVKAAEVAQKQDNAVDAAKATTAKTNTDRAEFSKDSQVTKKMSDSERASLVQSLKADLENQTTRFTNMMMQVFNKQGITGLQAGSDDFWRTIASGNFTVDAQTKAEAQQAISEDGYWGVKQTSQRLFDFAQALAGDNPEQMKKMQDAIEKGFKQAEDAWGGSLPSISGETYKAVNDLFSEYYEKSGK